MNRLKYCPVNTVSIKIVSSHGFKSIVSALTVDSTFMKANASMTDYFKSIFSANYFSFCLFDSTLKSIKRLNQIKYQ